MGLWESLLKDPGPGVQGGLLRGGDFETVMKKVSKDVPCQRRGEGGFPMGGKPYVDIWVPEGSCTISWNTEASLAGARRAQRREVLLHRKRSAGPDTQASAGVRRLVLTEQGAAGNHCLILTEVDNTVPFQLQNIVEIYPHFLFVFEFFTSRGQWMLWNSTWCERSTSRRGEVRVSSKKRPHSGSPHKRAEVSIKF